MRFGSRLGIGVGLGLGFIVWVRDRDRVIVGFVLALR